MQTSSNSRPLDYWLLWIVAIAALALNLYLINTLLQVRSQAGQAADARDVQGAGHDGRAACEQVGRIGQTAPLTTAAMQIGGQVKAVHGSTVRAAMCDTLGDRMPCRTTRKIAGLPQP